MEVAETAAISGVEADAGVMRIVSDGAIVLADAPSALGEAKTGSQVDAIELRVRAASESAQSHGREEYREFPDHREAPFLLLNCATCVRVSRAHDLSATFRPPI